jgi:TetR/AcrR family transcriptional repressor of nem operon
MPKTKQFDETDVLYKAKEVFCQKGYNGTSMDDLVQATGLSRSSIYDTFGDKHGLFLSTLNKYRCDQQGELKTLLEKAESPKKKIRLLFDHVLNDILTDKQRKGCLLINVTMELTSVDHEVADIANANMEAFEQQFYELVKAGQVKGEISRKFTAKALSRHLYNTLSGLRVTGRNCTDADTFKDIVKIALAILED